jgi:hypothetical protein
VGTVDTKVAIAARTARLEAPPYDCRWFLAVHTGSFHISDMNAHQQRQLCDGMIAAEAKLAGCFSRRETGSAASGWRGYAWEMRRVGIWIVALCVGNTMLAAYRAFVHHFVGAVSGAPAVAYVIGSVLVFAAATSLAVSWLEVERVRPPRARREPVEFRR